MRDLFIIKMDLKANKPTLNTNAIRGDDDVKRTVQCSCVLILCSVHQIEERRNAQENVLRRAMDIKLTKWHIKLTDVHTYERTDKVIRRIRPYTLYKCKNDTKLEAARYYLLVELRICAL